jgi:ribosomal protein S18 acetylase RimI-like enzyme
MMLGYRLSSHADAPQPDELCATLRPDGDLSSRRPGSFYMNTLVVFPGERGNGLGVILLAAAERKARDAHCPSMLLEVARDNIEAVRFYRRHGFGLWPGFRSAEKDGPAFLVLEKPLLP